MLQSTDGKMVEVQTGRVTNTSFKCCLGGSVDRTTGYGLHGLVSILGNGKGYCFIPQRPDRPWGERSVLCSG
jgi:hypothetical protein